MTREEKQKAIDALKISAPVMAVTQEEFNDYIQILNKVMDWLEQKPCEDTISRKHLLSEIDDLMKSPWFNNGKDDYRSIPHYGYVVRKEAVEIVRDLCIKTEPSITPKQRTGKWIQRHVIGGRNIEMTVCSECGEEFSYDAETGISEYNFCPMCGAKMEGE